MFSIVILSKNSNNLTACVQSILQHEPDIKPHQIICVDDGARDGALPALNGITWVQGIKDFVFARNANLGLREAYRRYDAAILLNDDGLLTTPGGFTLMYHAWKAAPKYGLIASSCNNVGNERQYPQGSETIREEPTMLCFVCVLIPRDVFEHVGPLDEDFVGYGYDDDSYSLSVREAGYKLGIFDGCFVDHDSLTPTFRTMPNHQENFEKNRLIFERKYAGA